MENEKDKIIRLERELNDLKNQFFNMQKKYEIHQHDGNDGTSQLRKPIELDLKSNLKVGLLDQITAPISNEGTSSEQIEHIFSLSNDKRRGFVNKLNGMQFEFLHQPNSANSFIVSGRSPLVAPYTNQTISTTSGGNTVTISGFDFTTNELAGAVINIFSSAGAFVESRVIASNTDTVITISGTWGATTSGGTFSIYSPVYMGSASLIFQRFYAQEGTGGGIRFGMGTTGGGQNGSLYMDATGDLYWRNKSGTATKLN